MWHHRHTCVGLCCTSTTPVLASLAPSLHLCWPMWHHHHTRVGQCGTITTFVLANVASSPHPCWQCGTITTPVLANVAPSLHLCWPMWHYHHIGVGQCGITTTSVLANVASPPHRCWPMWHHNLSGTAVLLNVLQHVSNDADRCENVEVKHSLQDSEKTSVACACASGL